MTKICQAASFFPRPSPETHPFFDSYDLLMPGWSRFSAQERREIIHAAVIDGHSGRGDGVVGAAIYLQQKDLLRALRR